jgi:hypothetical protein
MTRTFMVLGMLALGCGVEPGDDGLGSGGSAGAEPATVCEPGRSEACTGPGACEGAQVCNGDGTAWGACDCEEPAGSGGAGGSGGQDGAVSCEPYDVDFTSCPTSGARVLSLCSNACPSECYESVDEPGSCCCPTELGSCVRFGPIDGCGTELQHEVYIDCGAECPLGCNGLREPGRCCCPV